MTIRKAFKYKLKVNTFEQRQQLEAFAGCARFVWNKVLAVSLERLRNKQGIIWYRDAAGLCRLWRQSDEYGFLKNCHSQVLQQKLQDLERAFKDAFDKSQPNKRLPKFRKRGIHDSIRYPQGFKIDNRRLFLPKIGWVGFFKSRPIVGKPKNVTVSKQGGDWFVSIQVEIKLTDVQKRPVSAIGIDLGVSQFATLSDGSMIKPLNSFRRLEEKLKRAQRVLSRKEKWSKNFHKQKAKVQKLHRKITHMRLDFLHKWSTTLSNSHALIVVEALKIKNMSKSAKGDIDNPGTNVKAKSGLNKSILDQGWGMFRQMLRYKLDWLGGLLLEVSPRHTSQACHKCTHIDARNRLSQSIFECKACGHKDHADVNAAKNILAAGHAVLAYGETTLVDSLKQEPLGMGNLIPA